MKHLLLITFILLTSYTAQAQLGPSQSAIDVQHYTFHLTLSDESDVIEGWAEIDVLFEGGVQSFALDLIKRNQPLGAGMRVTSVHEQNQSVTFEHKDDQIIITPTSQPRLGERRLYTVAYEGKPADGLIIAKNKFGDRTFFGDNWPNRARNWLPTVDHPSDKASVSFLVTAPAAYQVVSSGILIEETDLADGMRLTHWSTDVPIPTKVVVIGAARFAVQHAGEYNDIPIQSWVYPQDREAGFYDFAVTKPMLEYFETNIGPYPYEKLANVQSKTRYGGMENASNIFYSETAITGARRNESTVAHEIAHQWFGNSVSEIDWAHIWLSEGFATYFTRLYLEEAYGRERIVQEMQRDRTVILGYYRRVPNAPLVNPAIEDPNDHLNRNTYEKGGWVLHMLRRAIGDEAFWEGIRAYYATYRDSNASSDDFETIMEEASGQNLDTFFQEWLYQSGQPILNGTWSFDESTLQVTLNITQEQRTPPFTFPLELGLESDDGSMTMKTVEVNTSEESFVIDVESAIVNVHLDPDTWLLFGTSSWSKSD